MSKKGKMMVFAVVLVVATLSSITVVTVLNSRNNLTINLTNSSNQTSTGNTNKSEDNTNWPMFQHDAQHTGWSHSNVSTTNQLLWSHFVNISSSPVVSNGRVFTGSNDGNIYALDKSSGEEVWNTRIEEQLLNLSVGSTYDLLSLAVANEMVYVGAISNFYSFDAQTGEKIWEFALKNFSAPRLPTIANGKVFIGCYYTGPRLGLVGETVSNTLYVLNETDGEEIWEFITVDDVDSSVAVANGKVFLSSYGKTYALDEETGKEIWNVSIESPSSLLVINNMVFVGSPSGVYALNELTGSEIWSFATIWRTESLAFADDTLFIASCWNVSALNISNGNEFWNFTTEYGSSSVVVADNAVIVCSDKIYALNKSTGELFWSFNVPVGIYNTSYVWYHPAIAGGIIFCGCGNGKLYAFGISENSSTEKSISKSSFLPNNIGIMIIAIGVVVASLVATTCNKKKEKDVVTEKRGGKLNG